MLTALTKMLLTTVLVAWVSSLAWARLRLPVSNVVEAPN